MFFWRRLPLSWMGWVLVTVFIGSAFGASEWYALTVDIDREGVGMVRADVSLPGSPQTTYAVLTDYPNWHSLFTHPPRVNSMAKQNGRVVMDLSVPASFLPMEFHLVTVTQEHSPFRLETQLLAGDFERYEWTWKLAPIAGGTQTSALLTLHVKPRIWVPDLIFRWLLRTELEGHFEKLRQRVMFMGSKHAGQEAEAPLP